MRRAESVTVHASELVLHLNYITLLHISVIRDYVQLFTLWLCSGVTAPGMHQ